MSVPPDTSRLKRAIVTMSDEVRDTLTQRGLYAAYEQRPAYQRNDYLAWIGRAQREETRSKRLNQVLDELEAGGVYMRMSWNG